MSFIIVCCTYHVNSRSLWEQIIRLQQYGRPMPLQNALKEANRGYATAEELFRNWLLLTMLIAKTEEGQEKLLLNTSDSWIGLKSGASQRVFEGQGHFLQMTFSAIELISPSSTDFRNLLISKQLQKALKNNGEGGIRTRGTQRAHRFSKPARSATPTPLQISLLKCVSFVGWALAHRSSSTPAMKVGQAPPCRP
jgi:hypothetical protein